MSIKSVLLITKSECSVFCWSVHWLFMIALTLASSINSIVTVPKVYAMDNFDEIKIFKKGILKKTKHRMITNKK